MIRGNAQILPRLSGRLAERRLPSLAALADLALTWQERARSRRLLMTLDDRALADIGIDRATADREANLPFWRSGTPAR
jgi:uncharacterized protein YjiS (DUF1127 family)